MYLRITKAGYKFECTERVWDMCGYEVGVREMYTVLDKDAEILTSDIQTQAKIVQALADALV